MYHFQHHDYIFCLLKICVLQAGREMKGWFDAFREEGGPTLYAYHNRTAVAADVPALALLIAALTLYLAFLAVFPGIRKEVIKFNIFTVKY